MKKYILFLAAILAFGTLCKAQSDSVSRTDFHLNVGSSVVSGFGGNTVGYMGVMPTFDYRASDKLTLKAGFAAVNSLSANGYMLQGREPRSLAPRKHSSTMVGLMASAQYQVNERLWIAGTVFHLGGGINHPWLFYGQPVPVNVTGLAADVCYQLGKDSRINLHFSYLRDEAGTFLPMLYDSYHSFYSPYGLGFGGTLSPYPFF